MICKEQEVVGSVIDSETRCVHYHSKLDIIAIKFYCCGKYFPCYECHNESGCGSPDVWPKEQFGEKAVLCGGCGYELTVEEYLGCKSECPACGEGFNPGCGLHTELYFEI